MKDTEPIYITGHQHPDTDSVASAIAYAFFKRAKGIKAIPCRLGPLNNETNYLLKRFGFEAPMLLDDANIRIDFQPDGQHMILNGKDITQEIRTPEIASVASQAAAQPSVREFLLDMQRDLAKTHNIIMDGRDIGTVVLPDASVKIYLTATPEARAMRRYQEYLEKGQKASYEEVLADQKKRDYDDSHRKIAPLKQAKDAVLVDTTEMGLQESIDYCVALIREKLGL